jgi:hypothetical protein
VLDEYSPWEFPDQIPQQTYHFESETPLPAIDHIFKFNRLILKATNHYNKMKVGTCNALQQNVDLASKN